VTDSTLRELERRFRASDSVQDETAWLRARVQAGELSDDAARLAAWLGNGAAHALHPPEPLLADEPFLLLAMVERGSDTVSPLGLVDGFDRERADSLRSRVAELAKDPFSDGFREQVRVRSELAAVTSLNSTLNHEVQSKVARVIAASEDYWVERSDARRQAVEGLIRAIDPQRGGSWEEAGDTTCVPDCCWEPRTAVIVSALVVAESLKLSGEQPSGFVSIWPLVFWLRGERDVGKALVRELVPWALGYSDPVRERVEAREGAGENWRAALRLSM
jgi:hypothetical protein